MKKRTQKTILAAYHRPIRLQVIDSLDSVMLKVNKIAGTKFTTSKQPLQLLREMPALKIANKGFYANAKVRLRVNSTFEIASTSEILERQSEFNKQLINDNKETIRANTVKRWKERYEFRNSITRMNRDQKDENSYLAKYVRSTRIIIVLMLIPVVSLVIFFTVLSMKN